jgi:hypothetical protein
MARFPSLRFSLHWALFLGLSACTGAPLQVPLAYQPDAAAPVATAASRVAVAEVRAPRNLRDLGTVSGPLGLHPHPLLSELPPEQAVRNVAEGALMARGLLAPTGAQQFDLDVQIRRLRAEQAAGGEAEADFLITLKRHGSGDIVYSRETKSLKRDSSLYTIDTLSFAPTAGLSTLLEQSATEAVTKALDDPAFRTAVQG